MFVCDAKREDIEKLRAKSAMRYDKLEPPENSEESIAWLDDFGVPRIVMTAQKVAEVYMVIDHQWATPAMRWAAIEKMHREMAERLKKRGFTVGYSFFADGVPNGYLRRLVNLGWTRMTERCMRFVAG